MVWGRDGQSARKTTGNCDRGNGLVSAGRRRVRPAGQQGAARRSSAQAASIDFAAAYEAHTTTVDGSIAHAATSYRRRGEVTYDAYARYDRMHGHKLQITEPDGHRTFVSIILHQDQDMDTRRLYVVEASVSGGSTPPLLFHGSFNVIDEDLNRVSYEFNAEGNRYRVIPGSRGIPLPE